MMLDNIFLTRDLIFFFNFDKQIVKNISQACTMLKALIYISLILFIYLTSLVGSIPTGCCNRTLAHNSSE